MAAGFLTYLAADLIEVRSAGTRPAGRVDPVVVEAMREVGVDLTGQAPEMLTAAAVEASDYVITMGCGDDCPYVPGKTYLDWELDDPAGLDIEAVRRIRDEIRSRVEELFDQVLPGMPS